MYIIWRRGTYVADQGRNLHADSLAISDNHTAGFLNPPLSLAHDILSAGILVVDPGPAGVLQRRKLVLAADLDASKLLQRRHGEDVEDKLLQLDAVRLLGLVELAALSQDAGDLLAGDVVRHLVGPGLDRLEELERVVVVDDVGRAELEQVRLLGVHGFGGRLVDLGVLDHVGLAVALQDKAHGLGGVALAHHLGRDVDLLGGREADEDRVGDLDEAVVDAVVVDVLDTSRTHVFPHARRHQRLVDAPVAVGSDRDLYTVRTQPGRGVLCVCFFFFFFSRDGGGSKWVWTVVIYLGFALQHDLALVGDARQDTLLKNRDIALIQTKVVVLLEELLCRLARRPTGHHVPGNHRRLAGDLLSQLLQLDDALGLDLEERLVTGETDVKAALGGGASETGTLAAGHQHHRNLVVRDQLQTLIVPSLEVFGIGVEDGGGGYFGEGFEGGGGFFLGLGGVEGLVGEFVDAGGVKVGQLVKEEGLLEGLQFIDERKHMALFGILILLSQLLELFGRRFTRGIFRMSVDLID